MKLYDAKGPNPAVVRMFAAEHGLELERVPIDMIGGENRRPEFLKLNPMGQLPVLQCDNGLIITEVVAICEYLDEVSKRTSLIGKMAEERAVSRMWARRIDLNILQPMADGFRFSEALPFFKGRIHCIPEAAAGLKAKAHDALCWLNATMSEKTFVCGDRLTLADIMLFANLKFFQRNGQGRDESWSNIAAWYERMAARPSATA